MLLSRQGAAAVSAWLLLLAACTCSGIEVSDAKETMPQEALEAQEALETQEAAEQDQVAILKQINRHNDDGSYTFGYEAADGSFKIETRDVLGNVKGMFGFVDEAGQLKRVSYSASNATGFQSSDGKPDAPTPPPTPPHLYQQIIRPGGGSTTRRPLLRNYGLRTSEAPTTTDRSVEVTTRRTLLAQPITEEVDDERPLVTTRPVVIQSIPRARRPQVPASTTEKPDEPTTRRPLLHYIRPNPLGPVRLINANGQEGPVSGTVPRLSAASFGHYIRPLHPTLATTPRPDLRKVVFVTRRPVTASEDEESSDVTESPVFHSKQTLEDSEKDKKGEDRRGIKANAVRRQLVDDRFVNIGFPIPRQGVRLRQSTEDTADVYGGSSPASPRPIPDTPFRGLFTAQPRIVQNALLQGYGGTRHRPPGVLQQEDLVETRNVPGLRIPIGAARPDDVGPDGIPGQYAVNQGLQGDLQQQLQQLILAQQQNGVRFRPQPPVPALTPFQQALMQTLLGGELPPEILQELYQQQGQTAHQQHPVPYNPQQIGYNQQLPYPPQQQLPYNQQVPYPQQQIPYPQQSGPPRGVPYPQQPAPPQQVPYPQQAIPYVPQQPPYNPQQTPYNPQPGQYNPQQIPYNQQYPYDPQQYQPIQFPRQDVDYQNPYVGQIPYQLQRRLRYRPRPGYISPPPFYQQQSPYNLRLPIPFYPQPLPYDSPQVQYQSGATRSRSPRVGTPHELMPEEYREALLLRMLLAIRAQQEPAYRVTELPQASPTTAKPARTLAPVRSVQILDPVTEEPTAKRSTTSSAPLAATD